MSTSTAVIGKIEPKPLSATIETITPEMARRLRDTAHFERQRKINQLNIDRLAAEMSAGRFTPGTQIYICILPDGSELLVNGNHTMEAVWKCGIPQSLTVTRKTVADIEEAGLIYAVFDIQKVRTWGDSLRASGAGDDIPLASHVMSALGVVEDRFGFGRGVIKSRPGRIKTMQEYRQPAAVLFEAIRGGPSNSVKLVKRAAILAVALETAKYQPSMAAEFWGRVAHDDGLTGSMPERALLSYLRNNRSIGWIGRRENCAAAAAAWNAAFRGEERQYVKPNQMTSFFLLGTPMANGLGE